MEAGRGPEPVARARDAADRVVDALRDPDVGVMGAGWLAAYHGRSLAENPWTGPLAAKWAEGYERHQRGLPRPDVLRIGAEL